MKKIYLHGKWKITGAGYVTDGEIPGSVYSAFLQNGLMNEPYYRMNENSALALMDNEFIFTKEFTYHKKVKKVSLVCEGIDTLCDLYVNGEFIARVDNMHREYCFDISEFLKDGNNEIKAVFPPLDKYIKEKQKEEYIYILSHPLSGFPHIRKAHYMLGWDWGPRLPDVGIWRDIYLREEDTPFITDFSVSQRHENGKVFITASVQTSGVCDCSISLIAPNGKVQLLENGKESEVLSPKLWWPNGLGEQPLYTVSICCKAGGQVCDERVKRLGLRSLKLVRENDAYGESFCHEVNGVRFFAMGADYIPEDNILSRCTEERTRKLLSDCIFANHNAIRVWGGGYYPDDYFFDICDELGLVVFLDLMFACTMYPFGEEFSSNTLIEIEQNIKRIRHHACLALIAGNNEVEEQFCWYNNEKVKENYLVFFEREVPVLLQKIAPEIAYVPSSPSAHGGCIDTKNENIGDSHYWAVWHDNLPFTEYRNHFFRYASEFGFQSFPCLKTVEMFTLPEDRNIFSRVMEMHQRNYGANGKILSYLAQTYLYPNNFDALLFASQLLQAEAIRYGVEHFRRNRGRCMGALYWQLNDVWPGASWSSIDYFGRYKALHYVSKRFYAPIMISCEETGEFSGERYDITCERCFGYETKAKLVVQNETFEETQGVVRWKLCDASGGVIQSGEEIIEVGALSVCALDELSFCKMDVDRNYLWYEFMVNDEIFSCGSVLFTKPKYFRFQNPNLTVRREGKKLMISAEAYARFVEIYSPDSDFVLSDNFFDMNAGEKVVEIVSGDPKTLAVRSVYDIK